MLVVGLTGGIASGKSTVSGLIKSYGIPVIDLDQLAREVVEPGSVNLAKIQAHFPNETDIINPDTGCLNRERLGGIIFNDPIERRWLNSLLHPSIRRLMVWRLLKFWITGHKICVIDSPLLIETQMYNFCGKIVVVYCSEEIQLQRLQNRNNLSRSEAKARILTQMPLKFKLNFASYIVDNSGHLLDLEKQVSALVSRLEKSVTTWIWLVGWLIPPFGFLHGLFMVCWRVWTTPSPDRMKTN